MLIRRVDFDPEEDLARVAQLSQAWRSLYRPAKVSYTPQHLTARMDELGSAESLRLYLVTSPAQPVALAILAPFPADDLLELMALAPMAGPDLAYPFSQTPGARRAEMQWAPPEPSGAGVFAFLIGEPNGAAWLDLPPEGLVLLLAHWGHLNLVDPEPFLAQRVRMLGEAIGESEEE